MEQLKLQRKGRGSLSPKDPKEGWVDCTLEFVLEQCELTRDVLKETRGKDFSVEMLEEESVMEELKAGKIVYTTMIMFRAVVGDNTCPLCGATYDGLGALSRKDNSTTICSTCGTAEAMEEMIPAKK